MAQSIAKAGVSPAEMMKLHNRMFRVIDSSKNGMLSRDEFERSGIAQKLGAINGAKSAKEAFESADADHSGSVSESESMAYFGGIMAKNPGLFALISMMVSEAERKEREEKGDTTPEAADAELKRVKAKEDALQAQDEAADSPDAARLEKKAYLKSDAYNQSLVDQAEATVRARAAVVPETVIDPSDFDAERLAKKAYRQSEAYTAELMQRVEDSIHEAIVSGADTASQITV
jgi:Ca2+-binding EF-hand superfamily protein